MFKRSLVIFCFLFLPCFMHSAPIQPLSSDELEAFDVWLSAYMEAPAGGASASAQSPLEKLQDAVALDRDGGKLSCLIFKALELGDVYREELQQMLKFAQEQNPEQLARLIATMPKNLEYCLARENACAQIFLEYKYPLEKQFGRPAPTGAGVANEPNVELAAPLDNGEIIAFDEALVKALQPVLRDDQATAFSVLVETVGAQRADGQLASLITAAATYGDDFAELFSMMMDIAYGQSPERLARFLSTEFWPGEKDGKRFDVRINNIMSTYVMRLTRDGFLKSKNRSMPQFADSGFVTDVHQVYGQGATGHSARGKIRRHPKVPSLRLAALRASGLQEGELIGSLDDGVQRDEPRRAMDEAVRRAAPMFEFDRDRAKTFDAWLKQAVMKWFEGLKSAGPAQFKLASEFETISTFATARPAKWQTCLMREAFETPMLLAKFVELARTDEWARKELAWLLRVGFKCLIVDDTRTRITYVEADRTRQQYVLMQIAQLEGHEQSAKILLNTLRELGVETMSYPHYMPIRSADYWAQTVVPQHAGMGGDADATPLHTPRGRPRPPSPAIALAGSDGASVASGMPVFDLNDLVTRTLMARQAPAGSDTQSVRVPSPKPQDKGKGKAPASPRHSPGPDDTHS